MIIITDLLKGPTDEGAKVTVLNLLKQIDNNFDVVIFSINGDSKLKFIDHSLHINKMLFSPSFYKIIRKIENRHILYIPESSITLLSFVRAKLLAIFSGKEIYILSLQPRQYGAISKAIIKFTSPKCIITQSNKTARYLSGLGVRTMILPLGVDDSKFSEFDFTKRKLLRKKYKINNEKIVLLHVGHIQQSRNLDWLVEVKTNCPEVEIIIVGSTYNKNDEELYKTLFDMGIKVIREFTSNVEDIYNLADYYIFPVLRNDGAIETPLSVLEAMACNLPIITTRFGSLPDVFKEDECFHYVHSSDEIVEIIRKPLKNECNNRGKIKLYTWKQIARQFVDFVEH